MKIFVLICFSIILLAACSSTEKASENQKTQFTTAVDTEILSEKPELYDGVPPELPADIIIENEKPYIFQMPNPNELTPELKQFLDKAVGLLLSSKYPNIFITGHSDNSGTAGDNMGDSKSRCQTIENYLLQYGITQDLIFADAKGAMQPVASNETSEGRAKNNRVEIIVQYLNKK